MSSLNVPRRRTSRRNDYNLGTEAIRTRDHRHELIVWNQDSRLGLDRRRLAIEAQRDRQGFPIPIEVAEACDDPRLAATGDLVSDVKKLLGEPELGIPVREQQRERARRGPLLPARSARWPGSVRAMEELVFAV